MTNASGPTSSSIIYDALIVGAGVSGLVLAGRLRGAGKSVALLEKSGGVGGRAATRRYDDATFDHGAQFYRVPTDADWQDPWEGLAFVTDWFQENGFTHRTAEGGITRLAKQLATGHEVHLKKQVTKIHCDTHITLETLEGVTFAARALYLSCPLPQTLTLLRASSLAFPDKLSALEYAPALVGLFRVESDSAELAEFKYAQNIGGEIFSCANQHSKRVSPALALTVTMDQQWSLSRFEKPEAETLGEVTRALEVFLRNRFPRALWKLAPGQLKKWRYSHPRAHFDARFLKTEARLPIYLLGDAFGGGGIFGAVASGRAVPL